MSKKKGRGSGSSHRGPTPRNPNRTTNSAAESAAPSPASSARYTPKAKSRGPFRPGWHRIVGATLIVLGLGIFVLNDLAWFDINLIPGGHNELWAMAGISTAVSSTWWFGWFDRTPKPTR